MTSRDGEILHASAVCFEAKGVLILGASGTGKTTLALQLMALGACLIADDRSFLTSDGIVMAAPNISDLVEVRGVGILHAPSSRSAALKMVVNLDRTETERLPPRRFYTDNVPLLYNLDAPSFPLAIKLHLLQGRFA